MPEAHSFLELILAKVAPALPKHWEVDHLCFRTDSPLHYHKTKEEFSERAELLIESMVGGRPIATYQLHKPVTAYNRYVDVVEIPAPKAGRKTDRGYEHIEIVIDCDFNILQEAQSSWQWDARAIHKEINPELEANFLNFNVKFHHHALAHIINIEKHALVGSFLHESQLLTRFAQFSPLISGTIPLGLNIENSDLDILFHVTDFDFFKRQIREFFPAAKLEQREHVCVVNFDFKGLPIEFYASHIPSLEQSAHRHLRIEGRLIKLLGPKFKQDVLRLKRKGFKTEPAFGKLLALSSPYEDLLQLYWLSDQELLQRFGALYVKTGP